MRASIKFSGLWSLGMLLMALASQAFGAERPFSKPGGAHIFNFVFYQFQYHSETGRWDLKDASGAVVLKNAFARAVLVRTGARSERVLTSAAAGRIDFEQRAVEDALGRGVELRVKSQAPGEPSLTNIFRFYEDQNFFTLWLELDDIPREYAGFRVKMLEPLRVEGPSGGLFLGKNPGRHKILDNGSNWYLDFSVGLYDAGSTPRFPENIFGADFRSDWSSIIFDPESRRSGLAGFLTGDQAGNLIVSGFHPTEARREQGKAGFSVYAGQSIYRPPVPLTGHFRSEVLYLDFFSESPFGALEKYAEGVAQWNKIRPWPGPVPDGWNSWGGYIHDLDEGIVLKNLKFASEHFQPFGMNYFQIDDGYQPYWGDWEADPEKFPHGMKWMADQIRNQSMIPGIWLAPFEADIHSEIFKQHPDWFLPLKGLVASFIISKDLRVLDLSKPAAQEHLRRVIRKYVKDWGYRWLKIDFAYYLLAYSQTGDNSRTVFDIYRQGMRIIRDEAGPETFVLGIGIVPANYGLVHGMRLSLDNMPEWNNRKSMFVWKNFGFAQGIVPTVRVVARRYWMNYRIWINHPDLIFFNNDRRFQLKVPPLTFDQALGFVNVVALSGGMVKIGDKMVDMNEREVDVIRRLLPVYPHSGRPLDLFEKATPEIWQLPVKTDFDAWEVVGLFNWGKNWEGRKAIPEKTRAISIKISELGLDPAKKYLAFDFWNEQFLGVIENELSVSLKPRSSAVIALRELKDHPRFLSYNRHISQGAIEIKNISWKASTKTLSGAQTVAPGFEYHLYFYRPEGFELSSATISKLKFQTEQSANIIKLSFIPKEQSEIEWNLKFRYYSEH